MPVCEKGFQGGDRARLDLPQPGKGLFEARSAARKPLYPFGYGLGPATLKFTGLKLNSKVIEAGQPRRSAPVVSATFTVKGTVTLPE